MTTTIDVYESNNSTLVGEITAGQWARVRVAAVANLAGSGELAVPRVVAAGATNPALATLKPGRIVRVLVDGVQAGAFTVEQPDETVLSPSEEGGELLTVKGREPLAARFDKVRWYPDRGLGRKP